MVEGNIKAGLRREMPKSSCVTRLLSASGEKP